MSKLTDCQQAKCLELTEKLISWPVCSSFITMFNTPDYFEVIKNPISLSQVKSKLQSNKYESVQAWEDDINLLWSNVKRFTGNDSLYSSMADMAASWLQKKKSEIPQSQEEDLINNDQKIFENHAETNEEKVKHQTKKEKKKLKKKKKTKNKFKQKARIIQHNPFVFANELYFYQTKKELFDYVEYVVGITLNGKFKNNEIKKLCKCIESIFEIQIENLLNENTSCKYFEIMPL